MSDIIIKTPEQIAAEQKLESDAKLAQEQAEKENAQLEAEIAAEEKAAAEKVELERLDAERLEAEAKAAQDKLDAEKAEEERLAAEKKAADEKAAADKEAADAENANHSADLQAKIEKAGELHFVHQGRVFVPRFKKVIVPGHGERTDLELCVDDEIHEYLVASESGVIKEIL
jgi:hypothetical protein